jgi:hypothetical protein
MLLGNLTPRVCCSGKNQVHGGTNVDASFSHVLNRVGIDMCIQDEEGRFVLAKTSGCLHFLMWIWGDRRTVIGS